MRRVASFIPVFFFASVASAVTLQMLTMDDMTQKSTDIVYARVLDSYGAQSGSTIYTHYRIQVLETWKGGGKFTEVMLPGGIANGLRQTFAGVPTLTEGQTYLMFLWAGPVGAPQVGAPQLTGLTQGLFNVSAGKGANLIATRSKTTEHLLDANGNSVQDQPVSVQLGELKRMVIASLSGNAVRK
jgi:hypothetical protein